MQKSTILNIRLLFFTKAKMLSYEQVEEYIGHAVGGVCPFAIPELETYSGFTSWIDVCKDWI